MRIGIDAMGGDQAPAEQVKGALAARSLLDERDRIVLVGDESTVREQLSGRDGWDDRIEVHHAGEVIGMSEPLLEPRLFEFFDYIESKGGKQLLYTNASLLTKKMAQFQQS